MIASPGDTTWAGVVSTLPLTATRPAAIQASASRREHSPAWAIALAMRMGAPAMAAGCFAPIFGGA